MANRIVILVCYFGKMPWYVQYFLHSCKFNWSIDFILISDTCKFEHLPSNVKHIYKTLLEINILAKYKLGFETRIEGGYKFCDFKPAYGFLFPELISGYDFWGQSDIDIIFGDLRGFLTDDLLSRYDYVSVRHDFPTGFFSLFRNDPIVNTLFTKSKDFAKVFSSSKHYCFDECNNVHDLLTEGYSIFDIDTEIESFMHIVKKAELDGSLRAHFDFVIIEGVTGRIKFDNGKLIYKNRYEVMLYHMIAFKKRYKPKKGPHRIPNVYNISPHRVYFPKIKDTK